MGHRTDEEIKSKDDNVSFGWSQCAEDISPGFVAAWPLTGLSVNQHFASGATTPNSSMDIFMDIKLFLEVLW